MKKNIRMNYIIVISIVLIATLAVGMLCGILYCAVGEAFPEGRYSTVEAIKLWRAHKDVCEKESRNLWDFRSHAIFRYADIRSAEDIADMIENGDYVPYLLYEEGERIISRGADGDNRTVVAFNAYTRAAGVKKFNVEGWGEVKIRCAYTITYEVSDASIKTIYETERGNVYSFFALDDKESKLYYFEEKEFFRFINDNAALREEWLEANKPDHPVYGFNAPVLLAEIENYETLNVTPIYEDSPAWILPTAICGGAVLLAAAVAVPAVILRRKKRKMAADAATTANETI